MKKKKINGIALPHILHSGKQEKGNFLITGRSKPFTLILLWSTAPLVISAKHFFFPYSTLYTGDNFKKKKMAKKTKNKKKNIKLLYKGCHGRVFLPIFPGFIITL